MPNNFCSCLDQQKKMKISTTKKNAGFNNSADTAELSVHQSKRNTSCLIIAILSAEII